MFITLLLLVFQLQNETDITTWERISAHEFMELELPNNVERTDTLGQIVLTAESDYSIIVLSIVPENPAQKNVNYRFDDLNELKEFYDGMEKGVAKATGGEIISSTDILVDSLNSRDYTLKIQNGEQKRFLATVIKDHTFMLTFWYHSDFVNKASKEFERTIESIRTRVSQKEQFNPKQLEDSSAYQTGQLLGKVITYLFIPGIILIIYLISRRKKRTGV